MCISVFLKCFSMCISLRSVILCAKMFFYVFPFFFSKNVQKCVFKKNVFLCAFMFFYVHFYSPKQGGSKRRRKCSEMYINVHFCTFLCISRPRHHFSCFIWSNQYAPLFFHITLPVPFYFIPAIIMGISLPFSLAYMYGGGGRWG